MAMKKVLLLLCMPQPQFLLPAIPAILVGTSLAFYRCSHVNLLLAFLALFCVVLINAGSNMVNDYFDHLSGNDWLNSNAATFNGGSQFIQKGIVSPNIMIKAGLLALLLAAAVGCLIVFLTKDVWLLILGLAGILGGFFWTAPPFKVCYRFIGEIHIFLMFGILPTFGAYYLQTSEVDLLPLIPSIWIGLLIAMVLLINSIPDREADQKVNKRTLVVRIGVARALIVYRVVIAISYLSAIISSIFMPEIRGASIGFLLSLPLAVLAINSARYDVMVASRVTIPNKRTILLFVVSGCFMAIGILLQSKCCNF